jgi:hypothetical protein
MIGLARVGDQPVRPGDLRQGDAAVERLDEVRVDTVVGETEASGIEPRELARERERRQVDRLVKEL